MNYIPNIISGLRVLLIPFFVLYVLNKDYDLALYLFMFMGISDCVDGILARRLNCVSLFGAYLDAIADKVMINTAFYVLYITNILPYYLFVLVICRDLIIFVGIIVNNRINRSKEMSPIFLSKMNTFFQIILVIHCMLFLNNILSIEYIQDIINVVILTTIASTLEYIFNYKRNIIIKNIKLSSSL
tara:strand:- start:205 stop:762 length:558 start_codon:yes stop_codon:yes gene_type:complete